jgi:UDP-glucose 4-epimerase
VKILVTGGSGLVGKYVVDELLRHNHDVGVLDVKPPKQDVRLHQVDVLKLDEVVHACNGYDAVIHMAGIPHPLNDPAEKVFFLNVNGTFNVLEAAARNGIKKIIFTSSESTLGFAFMQNRIVPEYFPIDEHHSLRPQDPYGLSKICGEQICRTYSARYGIRTVCLREPWIWVPEEKEIQFYKKLVAEYQQWYKNLWAYVHVFDVARAHRLAVENDLPSLHEAFFITARENWTGVESKQLIVEFYPEVTQVRNDFNGTASLISFKKAHHLLDYEPQFSVDDILRA